MFHPIKGGSEDIIQGYACQLPPVGYGKNRITGKLEYVGVVENSHEPKDQKWKRIELLPEWDKRRKKEAAEQESNPEHFDPDLEQVRERHWLYRLCGLWVKIKGKDVYLPPSYYLYLNWCPLDVGFPAYRDTDRRFFYVWEYCCEDPRCAGLVDIERRRMGKTYKSGSILLDRTSLHKNHHGGIQSKTAPDAKQVFLKTVVTFFKKFPDFFRPVYDASKGMTPTSELRFFQTARKGRNAEKILEGRELESWIDWGSSEPFHYDGSKLNTYVMDEFGKTMECNTWDRWNVVRFCLDQDGHWCGKALLTSTIEEMENGGENARKIWESSNPNERDGNGRTKSGLYRFFLPAFETTLFDEYGMPKVNEAKEYYIKQREGLQSDPRALSSIIRKNPFTIEEAFRIDGDRCLYDAMKLNLQLDNISYKKSLTERGNFVWENGERFTKVKWEKSTNGRWEITTLLSSEESNKIACRNGNYFPNNNAACTMGVDPFKYDAAKDQRRSDCAALVLRKFNSFKTDDPYNEAFICKYKYRAATTAVQYEDLLKTAWYYGCQILFERNVDNWRHYFKEANCENFLMRLPGEDDYGVYSDGKKYIHQLLCDYTEAYIDEHIEKVFFKDLIREWLEFDIDKTTAYDLAMAAGYTLIAAREKLYKRTVTETRDIGDYFRIYKAV
jgi:hypothetical protein